MDELDPGSVTVEAAYCPKTGQFFGFALPSHPKFPDVVRMWVASGFVIRTLTIDQLIEYLDSAYEASLQPS